MSRAEVEKQRVNSTIKSQQCDDSKNEYANQLQKTNDQQVNNNHTKSYKTELSITDMLRKLHGKINIQTLLLSIQIRALLGGRMDFIIVGGAPLSQNTHEFIRVCLGAIVVQVTNIK